MSFLVSLVKPFVYISVPALILRSTSPTARYYVNIGIYIGTMVVVSAWGAVVGTTMLVAGRAIDLNHFVARSFYALAGTLLDIRIEVEGEDHLQTCPALLMANHQSMLDVLVLGRVFPRNSTIMAKKELRWTPLGPFMGLAGALFVDRGNNASAIRSLEEAGESMKRRRKSLWIYPEGTRSSSQQSTMLPFKKGGFHLAVQAQLPITPIVTENYWRLYHFGVFNGGTIKIRVLPPIQTIGLTSADVPALAIRVREVMVEALREMSHTIPPHDPTTSALDPSTSSESTPITVITPPGVPDPIPLVVPTPIEREDVSTSATNPSEPDYHDRAKPARDASQDTLSESGSSIRKPESENGTETEEDEGMVLVGHPVRSG